MRIILGSASKARQELLNSLGYEFQVRSANIDEKAIRSDDFRQLPLLLAQAKSEAIQKDLHEPAILITSDSVAVYKNELREKPTSEAEAKQFLQDYATHPVDVITAVYVINTASGESASGIESGKTYFHKIPDTVIHELIQHGAIMQAAGGFIVEMPAIKKYIAHIEGNMDTIMGLPKILTKELIQKVSHGKS